VTVYRMQHAADGRKHTIVQTIFGSFHALCPASAPFAFGNSTTGGTYCCSTTSGFPAVCYSPTYCCLLPPCKPGEWLQVQPV
jgi:hypothetical protein